MTALTLQHARRVLTAAVLAALLASPVSGQEGAREGIKVHGRWTIEIHDPDGTLVTRRTFNNALVPTGKEILSLVLSGTVQLHDRMWGVDLYQITSPDPSSECLSGSNTPRCRLFMPPDGNLVVEVTPEHELRLSGSITPDIDIAIEAVETWSFFLRPDGSAASKNFTFARTDPVPVVAGQSILVSVTLSWS
jgi:hypothetical protein